MLPPVKRSIAKKESQSSEQGEEKMMIEGESDAEQEEAAGEEELYCVS